MERKKLESAAADNSYLRGLLLLPLGLLFFLAALGNEQVGPFRHDWVFGGALLLIGASCLPINHYYNENYGRATSSSRQHMRVAIAVVIGLLVIIVSQAISASLDLPVNAAAASFALFMLICVAVMAGVKTHHLIIWGALLVAGLLPVWDGADPSSIGLAMSGAAVMVTGIFDHLLLVRTFGSSTGMSREGSDVGA